jgi:hypothetical protein
MTGHRQFKELTEGFSDARKAHVASRVFELKSEMRQARERPQQELASDPDATRSAPFSSSPSGKGG